MKLLRYGPIGAEKPAVLDTNNNIRDCSSIVSDFSPQSLSDGAIEKITLAEIESLPIINDNPRIGQPIANVRKVICVGLNYCDHAIESGMPIPTEPILFMKSATALCGPNDDVELPKSCRKGDWEVELGVIIGKTGKNLQKEMALSHIAGYCIVNDLSERAYQMERGGQWVKGKSLDTFGPIGPYMVTPDEAMDIENRAIWLKLNGEIRQDSNTNQLIFGIAEVVSYISNFMTLEAGDLISTGTPSGVGLGLKPPQYLKAGDVMELGIDGLGVQKQMVVEI